jgi:RNA polymerase-binding transcription factor DksA
VDTDRMLDTEDTDPTLDTQPETLHQQSSSVSSGVDLGLLDELATRLAEVQSALERIDAGTYGRCEHCGGQVDDATLESNPTTRYCEAHLPFVTVTPDWQEA